MSVKMQKVDSSRGAPMGRWTDSNKPAGRTVRLYHVPLDSGGYDNGGAYWGHGARLYCAECTESDYREFTRASTRQEAARVLGIEALLIKPAPALHVCCDCKHYIQGKLQHLDSDRQGEIVAALTQRDISLQLTGKSDITRLGFTSRPCSLCNSKLGGARYEAKIAGGAQ